MLRRVSVCFACALAACGIDLQGQGPTPEDQRSTEHPKDGGGDELGALVSDAAAGDAPSESASSTCACGVAPATGFTPVAFLSDRSAACPGAFTTSDLVADASAGAGACTCGNCAMTSAPSCINATFTTKYDDNVGLACGNTSLVQHTGNGGDCTNFDGRLAQNAVAIVIAPSPGTCTVPVTQNTSAVVKNDVRACVPNGSTCACDPSLPTAFKTCLHAAGDVACPPQAPTKHLVGTSLNVACGSTCACTVSATCTGSAVTFYGDLDCGNSSVTAHDNACVFVGGGNYGSYRWRSTTSTPTCAVGSAPAPTLSLADTATICCP